jgi:cell division protein FtsW
MLFHRQLLIPIIFLFVIGLVMIFNTSSAEALDHYLLTNAHSSLVRQILYGLGAVVTGYVTFCMGYHRLLTLSPRLLAFFSFLLLLVFVPGIGITANGAKRWISVGGVSLQPSEFVKYIVLLYFIFSSYSLQQSGEVLNFRRFLHILFVIAVPIFLILIEPNNGTAAVIVLALAVLFFLTRVPMNYWAVPILAVAVVGVSFALNMPYVRARLQVYLHPELDLKGKGHQPYQAKIASGSGGLFGKGPGKSIQKLSYLPEAQNDYIAAIYAEEYGFVGVIVLIAAYSWIAYLGFAIAFTAKNCLGFYVASSFVFLIAFQAFLNLGVVSGLLPSTGLNLPFFSQGGSSLLGNAAAIGTLMNISVERA